VIDRGRVAAEIAGDALTMDTLIARSSLGEHGTPAHDSAFSNRT